MTRKELKRNFINGVMDLRNKGLVEQDSLLDLFEDVIEPCIAELEKESTDLKEALKGKVCKCMIYFNFKDLEKENAELKKEVLEVRQHLDLTEREWGKDTTKLIHFKTQLAGARKIINKLIEAIHIWDCKNLEQVEAEAEQFLKGNA